MCASQPIMIMAVDLYLCVMRRFVCIKCVLRCGRMDSGSAPVYDHMAGVPRVSVVSFSYVGNLGNYQKT